MIKNMYLSKIKKNEGVINSQELYEELAKYEYISFDIFDTLLKRNVNKPDDVFRIMEQILYRNHSQIKLFAETRKKAEIIAREKSNYEEVSLAEIYNSYPEISLEMQIKLSNLEMRIENELITVNVEIIDVFRKLISDGKNVYLISDMYLSKEFLEEILADRGITGYKEIYVSSDIRKTKRSGNLFDYFLNTNSIEAQKLCHVGDAFISDYEVPKKKQIRVIHVPKKIIRDYRCKNSADIRLSNLNSFINNELPINSNEYFKFGFDSFGPFLWGYVKWIYEQAKKEEIDKLYFFSRDGLIMKEAFDTCFKDSGVKTYYLEVSRRSLRLPVLSLDVTLENLVSMISVSKRIPLTAIFDGSGLNIDDYSKLLKKYNFGKSTVFDRNEILRNRQLKALYQELTPIIEKKSKQEYTLLIKYINQNNLNGKFGVIDIGWSGGMQRYLEQVLNKLGISHDIYGFYVGITKDYKRNIEVVPSLKIRGYIFDCYHNMLDNDRRSSFVGLFETFCLEQDGSVMNYKLDEDGQVISNRYTYEYKKNGKMTEEYYKVKNIQAGALEFIRKVSRNELLNLWDYSADELFSHLETACANPDRTSIKLFADFNFYDEGTTLKLAHPSSIIYYCFHLKTLKKDFLTCRWKAGFLKKLFWIKLPYKKLYDLLLKFR